MNKYAKALIAGAMALALAACASQGQKSASPIQGVEGKTVYTQRNLWIDRDEHLATNYAVGRRLPVNSAVEIVDTSAREMIVRVADSGREFTLANIPKYTKKDIRAIYERYFGPSRVDLGRFSAAERRAIDNGDIVEGMSKEAVLVARGYPPAHETPTLELDAWKYWRSRYDTILVRFDDNDRVSGIKN